MSYFVRCGVFTGFSQLLAEFGLPLAPLLKSLSLPSNLFDDEEALIELESAQLLLEHAAKLTHCPDFGLKLGSTQSISYLGVLGLIMRSSPNLMTAFEKSDQFYHMHVQGVRWVLTIDGDYGYLKVDYESDFRHISKQSLCMMLSQANTTFRLLCKEYRPVEVHFHFTVPEKISVYRQVFACKVFFSADFDGIVLKMADLLVPFKTQDDYLNATLTKFASQLNRDYSNDFISQLKRVIRQLLSTEHCTIDEVASVFDCDKRTLQRRLKAHKKKFTVIRDEERFNIACKHLTNSSIPMVVIAELSGFASISTFSRAFKKYIGLSPSTWRRQKAMTHRI